MPHTDVVSDINALAAQMVASGAYTAAAPGPGAISARLPDGTTAVLFTDRQEDLVPQSAAAVAARRPASTRQARSFASDAPTPHQIVFLVNGFDPNAFAPSNQAAYANAFRGLSFAPPNAGVSDLDVTLDNIVALGGAGIDLLDLSTHGGIDTYVTPAVYVMDSTTPITAANNLKYKADLAAGLLVPGGEVTLPPFVPTAHYAFTMAYLTKYLHFNPGAIVLNNSCFGQSPDIAAADDAVLRAAGVGRYSGWTKSVNGGDADQSDAFLFDRLLGEDQGSGLQGFAQQRDPIQRAFPLDDVQTVMTTETRAGAFGVKPTTYAVSDDGAATNAKANPIADGTAAKLVVRDYGGETVANPPTEYGLPSIGTMSVLESATGGVLTINGRFPTAKGTVLVGGTEPAILTWTTTQITVHLPASGSGSAGLVYVQSADGILSSPAPLTLWSAKLTFTESDAIAMLSSRAGVGSGNVEIDYALNIRSDVDPLVTTIDTPPVAQNFAFTNPMGSSTAVFAAYDGTFASNDGKSVATFSTGVGVPPMTPSFPPLQPGTFEVRGFFEGPPPASCNNGLTGVQGGPANILCPITGAYGQNAVFQCVDSGENPICPQPGIYDLIASYGAPYDAGGQLTIVMNPQTYALTATATTTQFQSLLFGGEDAGNSPRAATATMTGTFSAPKYAPTYALPASTTSATARAPFTAPAYRAHLQ
jgi:hypothetical protein